MNDNPSNIDLNNPEFQCAWKLLRETRKSVFLTGKAGSGKSTFLKYIRDNINKKCIVLAPTGISAVNVGGQTLHSFFKIPFRPLLPDDPDFSPRKIRTTLQYTKEKVKIIKELELIIIDEISMVRVDIIDFIDRVLRIYSNNTREPFGGKQLMLVGDVFQLEPVVTRDMKEILRRYYQQFYFFNAHVFADIGLVPIELVKMYRQTDSTFLSLLNRVRSNHATSHDIALLNRQCNPDFNDNGKFVITLAMRRDTEDAINEEHMAAIKSPEFTFQGTINNVFPENELPTNKELVLKQGAQVIFIRNDKENRWVNGTLGKVYDLGTDFIKVELENGDIHELQMETWENMQYSYDEKEKKINETVLGTFSQYPIKPAWALTVHKSQGLTFNHVVIDFGGGAFTSGQTYVALSRCTSLEGITLLKPLSERDIIVSTAVINFSRTFNNQALIENALRQEKALALYRQANHAFHHSEFRDCVNYFTEAMEINDLTQSEAVKRLVAKKLSHINTLNRKIKSLEEVIDSQNNILRQLAEEYTQMGNQSLGYGDLVNDDEVPYGNGNVPAMDELAFKAANANYSKAIRICPTFVDAYIGKARLLHTIGETDEALKLYKQALTMNSEALEVHLQMGNLYCEIKNVAEAIKCYKRAIKADKKSPLPYQAMALVYHKMGLYEQAEICKQKAEKLIKARQKRGKKK